MKIGEKMKSIRESRGLNQTAMAQKLGVAQGHISNLEAGRAKPSKQLVKLFCQAFGVQEGWLVTESEEPPLQTERAEAIGEAFQTMVLKMALEYLTILKVETGYTYDRIKATMSAAWSEAGVHPEIFFEQGDFEPVRIPLEHPMRAELSQLSCGIKEDLDSLEQLKDIAERKLFFDNHPFENPPQKTK